MVGLNPRTNVSGTAGIDFVKKSKVNENQNASERQVNELSANSYGRDLVNFKGRVEIVKTGDPILARNYDAETKDGSATFTLAKGDEIFPNIWDSNGGFYTPKKDDIIIYYGNAEKSWGVSHPDVLTEMEASGTDSYADKAVSAEREIMYETYIGKDGRDFTKEPLVYGESVESEKKVFPTKFLFLNPGTCLETLESANDSGKTPTVGIFQYVQLDKRGNPYVKDIKDLIKRLTPTTEESKAIFARIKDLIKIRSAVYETASERGLSDVEVDAKLAKIWAEALPTLMK